MARIQTAHSKPPHISLTDIPTFYALSRQITSTGLHANDDRVFTLRIFAKNSQKQYFRGSYSELLTAYSPSISVMIEVLIFHLHVIAALYAFTRRWQEANIKEGILALGLIGLVFTIGWAITGGIAKAVTPQGGFASWFTADTLSLVLLIIPEVILFRLFFLRKSPTASVTAPSA